MNFILKRETILTTFYTISLSLLISRFSMEYLYTDKSIYEFIHFLLVFIIFFNSCLVDIHKISNPEIVSTYKIAKTIDLLEL